MMPSRIRITEELREALKQKLDELKDAFNADVVTLHLYDPQRERLYFAVGVNLLQEERFMRGAPSMERVAGKIVRSGEPIIAEDAEHHPDLTGPFTHMERTKAAAGFPLFVPDSRDVMGVFFVDYRGAHKFEEDETERIQSWASRLAEFINRSLQGDQGRMLRDALRRETDLRLGETRLQEVVNRLWNILGDVDIALWTQERGKRDLRMKMHAGMDRDFVDRVLVTLDTDSSNLVSVAFVDGKEVLIESPQTDLGAIFNVISPVTWQHMLAVPVSSEYRRLGVLCAFRRERLGFTRRERDLVRAFASLIAVTIENEGRIIALNALHDVGVRLTLVTDLIEILQEVVRSACQVIGADIATVHLFDPARQEFYDLEHSAVFPPEARLGMEKPRGKDGLSARIIEQGRIWCEDIDAQTDPITLSTFVRKQGIKAYVGTPLVSIDEPLGVLYVSFKEKRHFSPEDLSLIQLLANYASTAIYRARLLNQRTAVTEIARDIASELDRDVLLQKMLERSLRLLDCEVGSIALQNKATGKLIYRYAKGKQVGLSLPVDKGLMTMAAKKRQPMRVGDITKEPWRDWYIGHVPETRSELDVPLLVGDELVGVLNFESPRYNAFSEEDEKLAMTLAGQAAVALYNAALFERREALAGFGQVITSGIRLHEDEILKLIYKQASELMDTDNMYVALCDEVTDTVRFGLAFVDGKHVDVEAEEGWQPRKAGKGKTEEIIRTKKPLFHATKAKAEEWYAQPEHKEYIGGPIFGSWLGVPMTVGEKVVGVIATYHPTQDYVYSSDDLGILQAMANQAAIALDNAHMFYDVDRRRRALVEFVQAVTSGIRLREDEVLELIYKQASELMDTNNMYIALYDDATDTARFGLAVVDGKRIDVEKEEGWQPRKAGKGRTEEVIRTKKLIFTATKAEAETWYAQPEHEEYVGTALASWLGVPMTVGEKVVGVIATYHPTQDYVYSSDDLEILRAMASQAAIALDSATLYRKAEKRRSQLETVREITNAITTELEPQACMERILDETIKLLGAHYATIQLVDEAADELVIHAQRGVEGRILAPDLYRIKIGEGITGIAAQEKRTIRVGNVDDAECYLDYIEGTRSEMATPLIEHGKVIGVLNVEDPRENAFDRDDKDLFELLAEEVVIAVQNARKVERRVEAEKFEYLGLLAGGVAHRVGSKGGLIRLHVNSLRKLIPPDAADVHAVLNKIERDNGYLLELSEALFKPADAAETLVGSVDVNQLLRQAIRRATIPPDIELSFHEEDVPRVVGNKWLVEVFVELITNALRAMSEREEKRLTICSQLIDENSVAVAFEDTGCGIASEEMPKLFNLFYTRSRGEETPSRGGYGLWYSKSIVTRMGGDLQIESKVDKGTQCTVLLSTAPL